MKECIADGEVIDDVSTDTLDLIEGLMEALDGLGINPPPALLNLSIAEDPDEDCSSFEIEVRIAPGIILPTHYGSTEFPDDPIADEDVISAVVEGVRAMGLRVEELGDLLHEARIRTRIKLAEWHAAGTSVRFIDVHLAPYNYWNGSAVPELQIIVERLGDGLEPKIDRIDVCDPAELEAVLDGILPLYQGDHDARRRMMRNGASGMIDQLAVNVMTSFGDTAGYIRLLRRKPRFWLPDETCIMAIRGHVGAGTGDPQAHVQFSHDTISVRRTFMPKTLLNAAVGRPVSELYEHEFLSSDMLVQEANCEYEDGEFTLVVRFTQKTHLFCFETGRIWAVAEDPTSDDVAGRPVTSPAMDAA